MASRRHPLNLADENDRLRTFATWPNPYIHPQELTAFGFYYTTYQDIVRCYACGLELGEWQLGDNPLLEHQNWRPHCPFLRDYGLTEANHARDYVSHAQHFRLVSEMCPLHSPIHQTDNEGVNMVENSLEMLGINETGPPTHSTYVSIASRLQSFSTWPISMKLRPEKLCEAGFFYSGNGDKTVCFHCGKEVNNWTDGDDPWVEHARRSPKCPFIILNQGRDFVENVVGIGRSPADSGNVRNVNIPAELRQALEIRDNARETVPSAPRSPDEAAVTENPSNQETVESQPGSSTGAVKKRSKSGGSKGHQGNSNNAKASKGSSAESKSSDKDDNDHDDDDAATAKAKTVASKGRKGAIFKKGPKKSGSSLSDDRLCKICWQEQLGVAFLPCGHVVACVKCAPSLEKCAVCCQRFTATVRVFLP